MKRSAVGLVAAALLIGACGGGHKALQGTNGKQISHAADVPVPSSVLGLTVSTEDIAKTTQAAQRAYVDSVAMYGLRSSNLLQATLQISRFVAGAKYRTDKFRIAIVDQIGNAAPVTLDVADQTVYLTSGNRQRLYVWYKGDDFYVLAVRQDYAQPRALLRKLLEVPA